MVAGVTKWPQSSHGTTSITSSSSSVKPLPLPPPRPPPFPTSTLLLLRLMVVDRAPELDWRHRLLHVAAACAVVEESLRRKQRLLGLQLRDAPSRGPWRSQNAIDVC